jgi:hypothetical protein
MDTKRKADGNALSNLKTEKVVLGYYMRIALPNYQAASIDTDRYRKLRKQNQELLDRMGHNLSIKQIGDVFELPKGHLASSK